MSFSPAGRRWPLGRMRALGLQPQNTQQRKTETQTPHLGPLPQSGEGTIAIVLLPRGEKVAVRPDEGARLATAKYSAKKNRNTNPSPWPSPPKWRGDNRNCPSPPRGRRWPLGRMRGLSLQPQNTQQRKTETQTPHPSPLPHSGEGTIARCSMRRPKSFPAITRKGAACTTNIKNLS